MTFFQNRIMYFFILSFVVVFSIQITLLFIENVINYRNQLNKKFQLVVFLEKNTVAPDLIKEKILKLENLKEVNFVSKEAVKLKLTELLKDEITLTDENPFPDSFYIVPECIDEMKVKNIVSELMKIPEIEEVQYDSKIIEITDNLKTIKIFLTWSFVILIVLVLVNFLRVIFQLKNIINLFRQNTIKVNMLFAFAGTLTAIITVEILRYYLLRNVFSAISFTSILLTIFIGIVHNTGLVFKTTYE